MNYVLGKNFFNRSSVLVAKDLLGCSLCRRLNRGEIERLMIVETEAYEGFEDKASHVCRGKTKRNAPMFEGPGTIYVYFTYGMHWMLNVVCGPKGYPNAVLIRGVTTSPLATLLVKGRGTTQKQNLSGPGRLTKYLQIDKSLNNKKLSKKVGLWIEPHTKSHDRTKKNVSKLVVLKTPRVGISYAGPVWSKKLYRFVLNEEAPGRVLR